MGYASLIKIVDYVKQEGKSLIYLYTETSKNEGTKGIGIYYKTLSAHVGYGRDIKLPFSSGKIESITSDFIIVRMPINNDIKRLKYYYNMKKCLHVCIEELDKIDTWKNYD